MPGPSHPWQPAPSRPTSAEEHGDILQQFFRTPSPAPPYEIRYEPLQCPERILVSSEPRPRIPDARPASPPRQFPLINLSSESQLDNSRRTTTRPATPVPWTVSLSSSSSETEKSSSSLTPRSPSTASNYQTPTDSRSLSTSPIPPTERLKSPFPILDWMMTPSTQREATTSGPPWPESMRKSSGPSASVHGQYVSGTLTTAPDPLGARTIPRWMTTSLRYQGITSPSLAICMRPSGPGYLPIGNEPYTPRAPAPPFSGYATEPPTSNERSKGTSSCSPNLWETAPTSTTPILNATFDVFNYNGETFGNYTAEAQTWDGYTILEPHQLPYSPPRNAFGRPRQSPKGGDPRYPGQYKGPRTSFLLGGANEGAGGSTDHQEGGSNNPPRPSSAKEKRANAQLRSVEKRQRARQLKREYEATQDEAIGFDRIWNFNVPLPNDDDKRKGPPQGRPSIPNPLRLLHE
ncbi:hypothetical protein EV421DRAFT_1914058 [Armillaria borealis]|uniref:Uncharacterized protein n=1 Tax=Armillaria borealis TaxID=47425 RepID=A0AA39MDS0_9AGAR|nr:hypothetical protein EV421DRAFT_1914058 [Armillaria borealis]